MQVATPGVFVGCTRGFVVQVLMSFIRRAFQCQIKIMNKRTRVVDMTNDWVKLVDAKVSVVTHCRPQ